MTKTQIQNFLLKYLGYGYLTWKQRPFGLYCFNYHRIGEPEKTNFDPNVFSCTKEVFENHIIFYKDYFEVINTAQLIDLLKEGKPLNKHYALITFDDGYIDNYEEAFPILKKHHVPAIFFVPTDYISSNKITWWDEVAWIINKCELKSIQLPSWDAQVFIDKKHIDKTLRNIINKIKQNRHIPIDIVLHDFREITKIDLKNSHESFFMTWNMLKEMSSFGMEIGSHSNSHRILSQLPISEQVEEIKNSKDIIEAHLKLRVDCFAYPEGGVMTYNQETVELLKKLNYELGFCFVSGINTNSHKNRFELKRMPVSNNCKVKDLKSLISLQILQK